MSKPLDSKSVSTKAHGSDPHDPRVVAGVPAVVYLNGRIVPYQEASFGLLTHALNYGTGLFAGMRGFWNEDEEQLFVFRPEDHFRRFLESARLLRMDLKISPSDLTRGLIELLRALDLREDCYIRPVAFYGDQTIGVRLHGLTPVVGIAAFPFGRYIDREEGAHVMVSSWTRVSDNSIPARGKLAGSYVNSALAKTDAVLAGFDEAVLLNEHGHVCEGSVANVFVARRGEIATPSRTDDVLEGITRATVIQLLREELGRDVVERSIDRTELYLADEAFFTGTGALITGITRVDHRAVGTGRLGPLVTSVRDLYFRVVRGRHPKYRAWCESVHAASSVPSRPASAVV
jgi:branched-chain amino acid aminotransferase